MFLSLRTLAYIFATAPVVDGEPALEGASGTIALVAANLFVVFFGMSWGPTVWILLGEMLNNRIRASARDRGGRPVSGQTPSAPGRSLPWPTSGSASRTASTPPVRCCRSSAC